MRKRPLDPPAFDVVGEDETVTRQSVERDHDSQRQ